MSNIGRLGSAWRRAADKAFGSHPKRALIRDLRRGPPEDNGAELLVARMTERLKQFRERFSTAGTAPVDGDIGRSRQKFRLRTRLWTNANTDPGCAILVHCLAK